MFLLGHSRRWTGGREAAVRKSYEDCRRIESCSKGMALQGGETGDWGSTGHLRIEFYEGKG